MKRDNRIVVDLNKVQWARFGYRNQYGDWIDRLAAFITYRGKPIPQENMFNPNNEDPITARRWLSIKNLIDIWTPELYLKLQANESLLYTGDKAKSIWQEWNKRIFEKKKGKKK